jgi:hypothetical protein
LTKYAGKLSLAADPTTSLTVEIDVDQGGLVIVTAGDTDIGRWPRDTLQVETTPQGYRLRAEGEELIFKTDTPGFDAAIKPPPAAHGSRAGVFLGAAALLVSVAGVVLTLTLSRVAPGAIGGALALVLGLIANRGIEWWEAPLQKGLATAAFGLGIVALTLAAMEVDLFG